MGVLSVPRLWCSALSTACTTRDRTAEALAATALSSSRLASAVDIILCTSHFILGTATATGWPASYSNRSCDRSRKVAKEGAIGPKCPVLMPWVCTFRSVGLSTPIALDTMALSAGNRRTTANPFSLIAPSTPSMASSPTSSLPPWESMAAHDGDALDFIC